jgi:ubiquinone/menaquinone biosynthesis C-methylase UbiE
LSEPSCQIDRCDIFDFMAQHVGLTVIHPGGLSATSALADACSLRAADHILDLGCGKGTTAIYLARKYGCSVTGIDLSEELVSEAVSLARRARVRHRTHFQVGDAHSLPFPDETFDAVVSQAVLVLVKDKSQVIREALRVTRPGGASAGSNSAGSVGRRWSSCSRSPTCSARTACRTWRPSRIGGAVSEKRESPT